MRGKGRERERERMSEKMRRKKEKDGMSRKLKDSVGMRGSKSILM